MEDTGTIRINLNPNPDDVARYVTVPSSFFIEPHGVCEVCGKPTDADFVDNGFGTYASQVGPWHCNYCGWVEEGCPTNSADAREICPHCTAWDYCHGLAAGVDLLATANA